MFHSTAVACCTSRALLCINLEWKVGQGSAQGWFGVCEGFKRDSSMLDWGK